MARRALVFDLDGTLWDSHRWYARLVEAERGIRLEATLAALRNGRPAARLLSDAGIQKRSFRRLCQSPANCELYPSVFETLETLARRDMPLGVVTNLPGWMATAMLEGLGLTDYFSMVVHYGMTKRRKPSPEPLLKALEAMHVEPAASSWYVGDTTGDSKAAIGAGLSFAWVSYGYEADPPECDRVINRFEDVLKL